MESQNIRVRFAPSPTGLLHVGNARTALYNWLFARHTGGSFLLRVEDTDLERSEARYEAQLMEDMRWMGLNWDEGPVSATEETGQHGPYRQSERLHIYAEHTERLLAEGKAYRCFCTPEELEAERKAAVDSHQPQVYSGRCRALAPAEIEQNLAAGKHYAVRLKIADHPLRFHDLVRGPVEFAAETVSDPILVRSAVGGSGGVSGGVPVYNYVVTIDDALMGITHVIRGDDHISNTPKQVAIYEAFGWKVPEFAHLSTILGADRERLSKRHGATSISSFREMGYLPEALVNYLALLGWGAEDGKTETFTLEELTRVFTLERVTPSPAVFDFDKLNWLNRHYLKLADPARIAALAMPFFAEKLGAAPAGEADPGAVSTTEALVGDVATGPGPEMGYAPTNKTDDPTVQQWLERVIALFLPYIDRLEQLPARAAFLFGFDPEVARAAEDNHAVLYSDTAQAVLTELADRARAHTGRVSAEQFKSWINEIKSATGAKGKDLFHPVRIAITGSHSGPEFDKVVPLIEEGAELDLGIPSVRERIERFVGV